MKIKEGKKDFLVIIISSVILLILNFYYKLNFKSYDKYTGIFFTLSFLILEYNLFIPILKKKLTYIEILKAICWISIFVTIYSILTYGRVNISSDEAMQSFLARTILDKKSYFPKEWIYGMGDIWVISTHTFILPFIFLKNQILARMLGNVLMILVTVWGMYYYDKKIFKNRSYLLSITLFLVFLNGDSLLNIFNPERSNPVGIAKTSLMVMRIDGMYTIYMFFIVILLTNITIISKKIFSNQKYWKELVFFSVLTSLISITGIRMIAYFTIPFLLTFLLLFYFEVMNLENFKNIKKEIMIKYVKIFLIIVFPAILGFFIRIYLEKIYGINVLDPWSMVFSSSLANIRLNLIWYIESIYASFGFNSGVEVKSLYGIQNFISFLCYVIIVWIIPILQLKRLKFEPLKIKVLFIFSFFHNTINFILIVFFGRIARPAYVLTTVYILILISSRYIMKYWLNKKEFNRNIVIFSFLLFSLIQIIYSVTLSKDWKIKLEDRTYISNELLKHGLHKGYSTFWYAYNNNLYSNYKLKISSITIAENKISAYKWLNDVSWFNEEKNIDTFLLLDEYQCKVFSLPRLEAQFGNPKDKFMIDGLCVYVFDYDIVTNFNNGLEDEKLFPWELDFFEENTRFENKILVIEPVGVLFGPYIEMKKGSYTLTVFGENLDKGEIDVSSNLSKNNEIEYKIEKITSEEAVLKFELKKDLEKIEFRILNKTEKDMIKFKYMEVK